LLGVVGGLVGLMIVTGFIDVSILCVVVLSIMGFCMLYLNGIGYVALRWCFGLDLLGLRMVIMSFWIVFLMLISVAEIVYEFFYKVIIVFLLFFLCLSFVVLDLFMFYVFFERVLIPTFLLIVGWGHQPERLRAGLYIIFYTLFASLPIFVCLLIIFIRFGRLRYFVVADWVIGSWWWLALIVSFLVKLPIYFLHLWLPRAHVEAPVVGSMILAGVLLRLGGYGLFRVFYIVRLYMIDYGNWLMGLGLVGGFFVGVMCVGQFDIRMLVAYSSVVHISLVMGGVISCSFFGGVGGLVVMLGHGLCSSGLFCLVGIIYERFHSRRVVLVRGLIVLFPLLRLWIFLICVRNMSAPPSFSLVGELFLMVGLLNYEWLLMAPLCLINFFCAVFSLYLYNLTQHGKGWYVEAVGDVVVREYCLLLFHWLPLNLMFVSFGVWGEWV
jgi:NADH-ubiquinone oxidoreductase chain 4